MTLRRYTTETFVQRLALHCDTQLCFVKGIAPLLRGGECPDCLVTHVRDENAAFKGLNIVYENYEYNS